ncbi:hypothetical protein ABIB25_003786 [Nakamurella sp. UYEF19]|uniref:hypothetical protein n=1 Tax=Nakamurella sp. UYEF19 TaxID=1756392 RepID=UPI00339359C4
MADTEGAVEIDPDGGVDGSDVEEVASDDASAADDEALDDADAADCDTLDDSAIEDNAADAGPATPVTAVEHAATDKPAAAATTQSRDRKRRNDLMVGGPLRRQ